MEAALRNSNEIICKHRKLRLQVPGKVFRECGQGKLFSSKYQSFVLEITVLLEIHQLELNVLSNLS